DVTNYVMLELGQPMHAFDLAQISDAVVVRRANKGEKLTLLDEREVELDEDTLLICDRARPLALAGIMGGIDSGISEATDSLFLEVAFFTPEHIAGRARSYGLSTDSSHRFERGVSPDLQRRAMERATALLLELVGGQAGPVIGAEAESHLPQRQPIPLRRARIERLLGFVPSHEQVQDILLRLGLAVEIEGEDWEAMPPPWRFDLALEADLIEEVGRVFGYNRLPTTTLRGELRMQPLPEAATPLERIQTLLVDRGYQEAISYSFVDRELLGLLEPDLEPVPLANPISSEMGVMRTSLWAGLLGALKHNLARQQSRVRLFEYGLKFISQDNEIKQDMYIAGVLVGDRWPEQWGMPREASDFYDLKGDVEALLDQAGVEAGFEAARHAALHPGQSAVVRVDGRPVGWLGCIHPQLAQKLEIPRNTCLFELELDILLKGRVPRFEKLSRFPSIRRDLAIVVDAQTPAGVLAEAIRQQAGPLLKDLLVFDVYQGEGVESGRKSIAFGLILQDSSRTLTDEDVEGVISAITAQLEQRFGATLRE
ncbi:MAG TPA: phenylalanine--tRNA ligase subunit beta, partial [Gammaproteobacteria bacterium]|nr:phenylalanine--tRNA ligase subunit beta [Gammaproteobacteria bacterium]